MPSMLSLLDVLPRHERVDIGGGQKIDVFGVSGEDIGKILERYPDAFQEMVDVQSQPAKMTPGLMGALLAACQRNGTGESLLGNDVVETRSRTLGIGAQMKIMLAMGRCTFPDGIGPFLEDYVLMSSAASEAINIIVSVALKDRDTGSQPMPKPSEQQEIPPSGS